MSLRSQLLKGILEGCILSIIDKEMVYGYELSQKLQQFGLNDVSEGSIYPILLRLQKEKMIKGEVRASPTGPFHDRYYFSAKACSSLWICN
ncbi:PadR family transcriptional regulator [Paenibacillus harenae]|uniref:PadR family transcriptional regulator n=1 Tax=Paenibacillus harenae TaxID=306543 RepID=UPI0035948295